MKLRHLGWALLVIVVFAGPSLLLVAFQAHQTGMTWSQVVHRMLARVGPQKTGLEDAMMDVLPKGEKIDFLKPEHIGNTFEDAPRIANLQIVDFDQDGLMDVLLCDTQTHTVSWIRQFPKGTYEEIVCAEGLIAPAHIQAIDFDFDGDLDVMVAVLGILFPSNDKIGSVVILENDGQMQFIKHVAVERIARVSDVRAGDLDGDGDMDLAVAQFGYDDGETRWLENKGNWTFESHMLQTLSGPINCEIVDLDGDNDLDIVLLVSQEWEEIYAFINDGKGNFDPRLLYGSTNDDFGSSGISLSDLDQDGDVDILYTNGDAFDYIPPRPRPWHGIQWLENKGNLNFEFHRIGDFAGAYNARPVDVDEDGDLDLFVVSAFNLWEKPEAQSFIWLENDGDMRFRRRDIANTPTHILALDAGDMNGDGKVDLVSGGMHVYPPFDRMARIMLWTNHWPGTTPQ